MEDLNIGDEVIVHIRDAVIVNPHDNFDKIKSLQIIAKDESGYYLYVPAHIHLKTSAIVTHHYCSKLEIDPIFLGDQFVYITHGFVVRVHRILDGMICDHCGEFFHLAGVNQPDEGFICYSCRVNPYR